MWQWITVGTDVDDSISESYAQLHSMDNVSIIEDSSQTKRLIKKKILGLSRYLSVSHAFRSYDRIVHMLAMHENKIIKGLQDQNVGVLAIESPRAICPAYIQALKEHYPKACFVLVLVNALSEYPKLVDWVKNVEEEYDFVYTCNKKDAIDNGWRYRPDCYTPRVISKAAIAKTSSCDLLFLGADKGRAKLAYKIFKRLSNQGIKCKFYILGNNSYGIRDKDFVFLNKPMSYADYLSLVGGASAILELVANNERFCTLRTMEALSYGKLLITNNTSIINEPFYKENQIMVIGNEEDIDPNRIFGSKFKTSDYFLPEHFLHEIEEL